MAPSHPTKPNLPDDYLSRSQSLTDRVLALGSAELSETSNGCWDVPDRKIGSKVSMDQWVSYNLLINGIYLGYNPFTNHLPGWLDYIGDEISYAVI